MTDLQSLRDVAEKATPCRFWANKGVMADNTLASNFGSDGLAYVLVADPQTVLGLLIERDMLHEDIVAKGEAIRHLRDRLDAAERVIAMGEALEEPYSLSDDEPPTKSYMGFKTALAEYREMSK